MGLLDADLYGPSLPSLIRPSDTTLRQSSDSTEKDILITPLTYCGVKMLSLGWVNRKSGVPGAGGFGAAVMRGAMSSKVITQLLTKTDWGEVSEKHGWYILYPLRTSPSASLIPGYYYLRECHKSFFISCLKLTYLHAALIPFSWMFWCWTCHPGQETSIFLSVKQLL